MAVCAGCHHEIDNGRKCCAICELVVPAITGQGSNFLSDPITLQSLKDQLGDYGKSIPKIWNAIRGLRGSEGDWALGASEPDSRSWIMEPPSEWRVDSRRMDDFYRSRGNALSIEEMRILQKGGCLPDGSYLTWNGGFFYLDGMKIRVPYRGLSKILEGARNRTDIDYRKLLLSIDLALRDSSPSRVFADEVNTNSVIHPVFYLFRKLRSDDSFIDRTFHRIIHQNDVARKAFFQGTEWFDRWMEMENRGTRVIHMSKMDFAVPRTLMLSNGRLQLRVRRSSGWRRISLDNDPDLWSKVVTWCLSPPRHEDVKRLHCIQQHAFVDEGEPLICGSELRGVEFLRRVVQGNERVRVDRQGKCIVVKGSSGLSYEVKLSRNPHGARFQVYPVDSPPHPNRGGVIGANPRGGFLRERRYGSNTPLCIVELPELRKLVFGDAIATIVMALLDDLKSQRHIHTLRGHIEFHMHRDRNMQLSAIHEVRNLRGRLRNNDIQRREDRYSNLFPRLWGVLLRRPLGERMTFRAMRRGRPNVSFDGCATLFETTNRVDRNVLYDMLDSSGWIRDSHEEGVRGVSMIFIRTGTGNQDLSDGVERFCATMDERMTLAGGVRINEGPLADFYERDNPGIAELLPGTDGLIR